MYAKAVPAYAGMTSVSVSTGVAMSTGTAMSTAMSTAMDMTIGTSMHRIWMSVVVTSLCQ